MLDAEYVEAVERMTAADFENLEAKGCRPEIVTGMILDEPPVGKVRAQTFKDGSWQPIEDGKPYYVCPVIDGDVLDLTAWLPSKPAEMFTRTGLASVINPDAIMIAHLAREPLFIFSDSLEWLRGDCKGVVPVRFDAGTALALCSVELLCQTPEIARRINAAFDFGRPNIRYLNIREAA